MHTPMIKPHVVLDDQNTQTALIELDDFIDQLLLLGAVHAGRRLVEQKQFGLGGQRSGNFQSALFTVGQSCRPDRSALPAKRNSCPEAPSAVSRSRRSASR